MKKLVVAMLLTLSFPSLLASGCSQSVQQATDTPVATNKVKIVNFSFQPPKIVVSPGTTVTWTNEDAEPHTITSDNRVFESDRMEKGGTYSYTFRERGKFTYYCVYHPLMKGEVEVK